MSGSEDSDATTRRRGELRLTIALWVGMCAAVVPLMSVVSPGVWIPGSALVTAGILAVGYLMRRLRAPAIAVTLAELAVWAGAVTAAFFSDEALLAVIPTDAVFRSVPTLLQEASGEILLGVAPLAPTSAVTFLIIGAMGLLTVALDHVVLTARMPLLAGIALVAVWLIPAIAVPGDIDVLAFAFLGIAVLALIRAETRTREAPEPGSSAGVTAVAATIGAVAIIAALVGGPALPAPVLTTVGSGVAASIDPTLELGDDLRRREDVSVLTLRTDAPALPYLRVATLSVFDGAVWRPDRLRSVSLADVGMEPVVVDDGIRVTEYRTNVQVTQLSSAYLPLAFPAVEVTGLDGLWRTVAYSRTVLSGQANAQGQSYEVVSHVPRPTAEQIRASEAETEGVAIDVLTLPEGVPEIVGDVAREVTAGAATDYDRLLALQAWFRGPEFTYSLSAPVQEGFDGTGIDAVAAFLDVREGYCVHFAGAFALMARVLDMPSRVVVGFLPGEFTGESAEGQRVAEVKTSQLHAWPEVHFEGIGWVAFEPTKGLGNETRFQTQSEPVDDSGVDVAGPTPTTTPTASASAAPTARPDAGPTDATGAAVRLVDLRPYLAVVGAVLLLAVAPVALRTLRRRMLAGRARSGDVGAAWRMLQDDALDLGVAVPASESPRAFGARLIAAHDAPAGEVSRLVAAIERQSYARAGLPGTDGARLAADAETIRATMLAACPGAIRARAILLPRSLVVRPGSAFASTAATAGPRG